MLELVDLLHMTLIAMQDIHPLLEVLELANKCRRVVNNLIESVSAPILFAGSFAGYYLSFLKKFRVDWDAATENVKYALGGGIPSIMHACRSERESIDGAKDVFKNVIRDLLVILDEHNGRGQRYLLTIFSTPSNILSSGKRILKFDPFVLKNVQILKLILQKFDDMESFCRYYEHYFGFVQYQHLHRLLRILEKGKTARAAPEENSTMIDLWTRYERFTLHFPIELELLKDYSQATSGVYRIRSTDFETSSMSSIYSQLSPKYRDWWDMAFKDLERLGRQPGRLKYWILERYLKWYRHMCFLFHHKSIVH
jgi:hypothetical protein